MVNTSTRPIFVDGVRLDTLAWNVEKISRETASRRANDVSLPTLDGSLPSMNDGLEPTTFGLAMWLRGTDANGGIPAIGSQTALRNNLDELLHLFGKRHGLLEVVEQTGPGAYVTNWAKDPEGTALTFWSNLGSATQTRTVDATVSRTGGTSVKATFTNAVAGPGGLTVHLDGTGLVAGDVVRWRMWARTSKAMTLRAWWERTGGTYIGGTGAALPAVAMAANTWTAIEGSYTVTAASQGEPATQYYEFGVYSDVSTFISGDALWGDSAVITVNEPLPPDEFSGATPADAAYSYQWTGTANASASLRQPIGRRRALAKVSASIAPDLNNVGTAGVFSVALTIPAGVWEDADTSDWTKTGTSQVASEVTTLTGGTERTNDGIFLVTGPVNTPRITDPATGMWVELGTNLAAGQFWRLNSSTWASRHGTGLSLGSTDTTGTDGSSITNVGGPARPYALPLVPVRDTGARRVRVTLSGTSMTASTALSIRARKKFA